ncbi:MAG: beta-1,3-glucanase family protein [Trebonia sp.]
MCHTPDVKAWPPPPRLRLRSTGLAAAFSRSTLVIDSDQPDGEHPARYYAATVTNQYARIVHATLSGGLGYVFPYDDVTPDGGVNQAGPVSSGSPAVLAVAVGSVH